MSSRERRQAPANGKKKAKMAALERMRQAREGGGLAEEDDEVMSATDCEMHLPRQ